MQFDSLTFAVVRELVLPLFLPVVVAYALCFVAVLRYTKPTINEEIKEQLPVELSPTAPADA